MCLPGKHSRESINAPLLLSVGDRRESWSSLQQHSALNDTLELLTSRRGKFSLALAHSVNRDTATVNLLWEANMVSPSFTIAMVGWEVIKLPLQTHEEISNKGSLNLALSAFWGTW